MAFDVGIALTWILFLALFPMAFIWLRRAWRVMIKHDHSEVALKGGVPPKNPHKWAPVVGLLNLTAGSIAVITIVGVGLGAFPYDTWSAMAGSTIWIKIIADFAISRQAHLVLGRKKKTEKPS